MRKWILVGILILAGALRLVALNRFPVGFTPDEASFGYDAYSILKTGKDQWGTTLPLVLKSFGDYKAPLYSYILIPFIGIGGLTKEMVRLPNALIGTMAIFATYLLVLVLFKKKDLALFASFLLSISSWHIMMSRGGFEANLTTFFLPFGLYLLIRGLEDYKSLTWGALSLSLNLFSYHSAKVVTPLLFLSFLIIFRREIAKIPKVSLVLPAAIFTIFAAATLYTFSIGAGTRVTDVSIFNGAVNEASDIRHASENSGLNQYLARAIYNKYTVSFRRFVQGYLSYFSGQFLFVNGPAESTYGMIPGRGVLYWFELPFLVMFFAALFKSKDKRPFLLLIAWILTAPIAAALATGPGYAANRAVIMLPALPIILALGAVQIPWNSYKKIRFGYILLSTFVIFLFLLEYFAIAPAKSAQAMLYGNLEAATWLAQNNDGSQKVVVDKGLSEPHIYFAFANKWDPKDYQKETQNWKLEPGVNWVDQIPDYNLGSYNFKTIHLSEYKEEKDIFLVAKKEVFQGKATPVVDFNSQGAKDPVQIVKL